MIENRWPPGYVVVAPAAGGAAGRAELPAMGVFMAPAAGRWGVVKGDGCQSGALVGTMTLRAGQRAMCAHQYETGAIMIECSQIPPRPYRVARFTSLVQTCKTAVVRAAMAGFA